MSQVIRRPSTGYNYTVYTELHVHECCTCGIVFAYPDSLDDAARKHSAAAPGETISIYCPRGHRWHYTGKNAEQRLRDELEWQRTRAGRLAHELGQTEASRRAQKAAATRARNERNRLQQRAKAGVCPCCKRTVKQLADHMATKHPDFEPGGEH